MEDVSRVSRVRQRLRVRERVVDSPVKIPVAAASIELDAEESGVGGFSARTAR
jgi:hypothetical protein